MKYNLLGLVYGILIVSLLIYVGIYSFIKGWTLFGVFLSLVVLYSIFFFKGIFYIYK